MSFQIHNLEQQTEEWFELRRQHPLTASNATAIRTAGAGLETLCWKAVAETISSKEVEHYSNEHTDRGNELEEQAIAIYELETGNEVEKVGFITNDICEVGGCSPDGLIGKDGMCEVKCPDDVKFLKLLVGYKEGNAKIANDHYRQMQMQLLFAEREWNDYIVFNPNFKESILVQRVLRDEKEFEKIKAGLKKGEDLIKELEEKFKN